MRATAAKAQGTQPASEYESAMSRAGRLLILRARTESEVRSRLLDSGFGPDTATRVIDRLRELHLVDDAEFAREWIEERTRRKSAGPRILVTELRAKGVADEVIDEAVAEAFPDEGARAQEVAASLLPKWSGLTLERQVSRLGAALARKGFSEEAVEAGVRAVLPPEGWD
jgi:regulatory protein